jgi:hypothetical protein
MSYKDQAAFAQKLDCALFGSGGGTHFPIDIKSRKTSNQLAVWEDGTLSVNPE